MSLTRDEWVKMWKSIKIIEKINTEYNRFGTRVDIERQVIKIKKQIQSVIGQME